MFRHIPSLVDSECSSGTSEFLPVDFPADLPPTVLNRRGSFPFTTSANGGKQRKGSKAALLCRTGMEKARRVTCFETSTITSTKTALTSFAEMKEMTSLFPDRASLSVLRNIVPAPVKSKDAQALLEKEKLNAAFSELVLPPKLEVSEKQVKKLPAPPVDTSKVPRQPTFSFLTPRYSLDSNPKLAKVHRKISKEADGHRSLDGPPMASVGKKKAKVRSQSRSKQSNEDPSKVTMSKGAVLKMRELARIRGRKPQILVKKQVFRRSLSVPILEFKQSNSNPKLQVVKQSVDHPVIPIKPKTRYLAKVPKLNVWDAEEDEDENESINGISIEHSAHSDLTSLTLIRDMIANSPNDVEGSNLEYLRKEYDENMSTSSKTMPLCIAPTLYELAAEAQDLFEPLCPKPLSGWSSSSRRESKDFSIQMLHQLFQKTVERYAEKWIRAAIVEASSESSYKDMLSNF